ncbi:MAG: CvpA family protein [Gemmatimonadota bacterium]|nr:CvpA family protein [Gemmatimonadota bacterium]
MNWIDIGIVALLLYQAAAGFRNGFRPGLLDLAALLATFTITITQITNLADLNRDFASAPPMMSLWISFFGCFVISILVLNSVLHMAGQRANRRVVF